MLLKGKAEAIHWPRCPGIRPAGLCCSRCPGPWAISGTRRGCTGCPGRSGIPRRGFCGPPQGHQQDITDHLGLHRALIAQPTTRREYRAMTAAAYSPPCRPEAGEVLCPPLVRDLDSKGALQMVRLDVILQTADVVRGQPASPATRLQFDPGHQPGHLVKPAALAQGAQVALDAWTAIGSVTKPEALTNDFRGPRVALAALGRYSAQPFTAARHHHGPTHHEGGARHYGSWRFQDVTLYLDATHRSRSNSVAASLRIGRFARMSRTSSRP